MTGKTARTLITTFLCIHRIGSYRWQSQLLWPFFCSILCVIWVSNWLCRQPVGVLYLSWSLHPKQFFFDKINTYLHLVVCTVVAEAQYTAFLNEHNLFSICIGIACIYSIKFYLLLGAFTNWLRHTTLFSRFNRENPPNIQEKVRLCLTTVWRFINNTLCADVHV